MTQIKIPKKLIEVALPLDDISAASVREKSIRHGHPSTLHLWWARRPLAAARAVIFAQMVNDPGYQNGNGVKRGVNKKEAAKKREVLFDIMRDLVIWENSDNEEVLNRAREAIQESWRETCHLNRNHPQAAELFNPEKLPALHDPFAGAGAIPLEAQRLGLVSYASDLNPVAVMISKAMIEIPPKFAGQKPIGPPVPGKKQIRQLEEYPGAQGLAEDVRRYGHWMREEAFKQIGHLYPKVLITKEMTQKRKDLKPYVGEELTVIAWLWARTVKSPNPAFSHVDVPLMSTFVLSSKKGNEAYVQPVVKGDTYRFEVKSGEPPENAKAGTKAGRGASFYCVMSQSLMSKDHIRGEFQAKRAGEKLMAIVAEGKSGRVYLSPTSETEKIANEAKPEWKPDSAMNQDCKDLISGRGYGFTSWHELFTPRQLLALTTFSDLVHKARIKAIKEAKAAGMADDGVGIDTEGTGATAYGDALAVYLGLVSDKVASFWSSICHWNPSSGGITRVFGRQAIPMIWDYAEANPFSDSSGNWVSMLNWTVKVLAKTPAHGDGKALQQDAATQAISQNKIVSTGPPYYDNISYADLSDFFYVWMRRTLRNIYPTLFSTMAVPKAEELVATPYRHGSKEKAETFFMDGMTRAIANLAKQAHPAFPVSIYYAFKQSETKAGSTTSAGWVTFLEAVIQAGFAIVGTWPMRTEMANRMTAKGTNALASSVVLICCKRDTNAKSVSRREFQRELRREMPEALEAMSGNGEDRSPISTVDLAQATIGPGMAIFSKYKAVLNQDGSKMSVKEALVLINRIVDECLNPDSGNFDADTLFCNDWFGQYGWNEGPFGEADILARAKGTSVEGITDAGVIKASRGKVRLLKWNEYPQGWDPETDLRTPVWEACHHLIQILNRQGESAAGELFARMPEHGENIRRLSRYLYTLCERKKWAQDARAYNELDKAWDAIVSASHDAGHRGTQTMLEL